MTQTPEQIAAGLNVMAKKILLNGDWERGSLPVVHPRISVARLILRTLASRQPCLFVSRQI